MAPDSLLSGLNAIVEKPFDSLEACLVPFDEQVDEGRQGGDAPLHRLHQRSDLGKRAPYEQVGERDAHWSEIPPVQGVSTPTRRA